MFEGVKWVRNYLETCLQHPFLQGDLSRRLTRDVLDRVRNPQPTTFEMPADDDDEVGCTDSY